ncbi:hypothetical protein AYX07_08730 [Thermoactinomyces sp. AS95]|nr:hypothetical protein JS81_14270 [Thermoactinomyces sp. Gus2-1]KYQ86129.1 hypothetical protein AYX07_08730 [Thermoactinomyces sp. AS95]
MVIHWFQKQKRKKLKPFSHNCLHVYNLFLCLILTSEFRENRRKDGNPRNLKKSPGDRFYENWAFYS